MAPATPYDPQAKKPVLWRGWLLYILPLPLLPATLGALGDGDTVAGLARGAGLALVLGAASFIRKGIRLDNETLARGLRRRPSTVRYRLVGAAMATLGTFLVAWLGIDGQHGPVDALLFSAAVMLGCYLYYDFDLPERREGIAATGITTEELVALLDEAEGRIAAIEAAAKGIGNTEFRDRLRRIATGARGILATIERDPVDARRARKFLKVYLDGTRQVVEGYARAHRGGMGGPERGEAQPALEDNFRRVLGSIETVVGEQQAKLAENDTVDLDVKMEVLQMQLDREGVT